MSITAIKTALSDAVKEPAFYAKANFIKDQRILGISFIAMGDLAIFASSFTAGMTAAIAAPLISLGCGLIGASLIQQVVGDAHGCSQGKVKRIIAGIFLMIGGPVGWTAGGVLWYLSNRDNRC